MVVVVVVAAAAVAECSVLCDWNTGDGAKPGSMLQMEQGSAIRRAGSSENLLPNAMSARNGQPPRAPPPGNARVVPAAANRRLSSFREVAGAVGRCNSGGGITLSESIRNSGAVLEEHEAKIRTLQREMEGLNGQLQGKERELQTLNSTMTERIEKKQKEIEQLRDNARASEMAIRGLEDEIRLLRKQNNEIDRASRHGSARNTNQPSPSGDEELQNKLAAAEQQVRQLKIQVSQGEEEAHSLRQKLAALQAKLDAEKAAQKGGDKEDKGAQDKIAALEKAAAEREKDVKLLRGEVDRLKAAVAKAEAKAEEALKKQQQQPDKPPPSSEHELSLKELKAKLKNAEDKLASATEELQKRNTELEAARKAGDDAKKAFEAANSRAVALEAEVQSLQSRLSAVEKELGSVKDHLSKAQAEAEGLRIRGKQQEEHIKARDVRIAELEKKVADLQALINSRDRSDGHANAELEALRVRCQAAEDATHTHKMAATEARAVASLAKTKADALEKQLSESQATVGELRNRIVELEKADKESLARLCRIRELEAECQTTRQRVGAVESERDSAQAACRVFEKEVASVKATALNEKALLEAEVRAGIDKLRGLEAELAELRKRPGKKKNF